ncbi:hypothetical protein ACHAXS_006925 [Conticribra weissflogii]
MHTCLEQPLLSASPPQRALQPRADLPPSSSRGSVPHLDKPPLALLPTTQPQQLSSATSRRSRHACSQFLVNYFNFLTSMLLRCLALDLLLIFTPAKHRLQPVCLGAPPPNMALRGGLFPMPANVLALITRSNQDRIA